MYGKKVSKHLQSICLFALIFSFMVITPQTIAYADTYGSKNTGIKYNILAKDEYNNWEGVSNVSQFLDSDGNFCFAYYNKKTVTVVKTKNGKPQKKKTTLQMANPI